MCVCVCLSSLCFFVCLWAMLPAIKAWLIDWLINLRPLIPHIIPQNGDRILTINFVTSLQPMYCIAARHCHLATVFEAVRLVICSLCPIQWQHDVIYETGSTQRITLPRSHATRVEIPQSLTMRCLRLCEQTDIHRSTLFAVLHTRVTVSGLRGA